jgi:hypothetical protein
MEDALGGFFSSGESQLSVWHSACKTRKDGMPGDSWYKNEECGCSRNCPMHARQAIAAGNT